MTSPEADPLADSSNVAARFELNSYQSDAEQILRFLDHVYQNYLRSPYIREFTVSLFRGLDNNDLVGQTNRVIAFVKTNLTYVRDPIDSEYVISPIQLIQQWKAKHFMAGDCDDHVLLMNSMFGSVGIPTKFVGVKFGNTDVFNHVISGIELDGHLYLVDPCSKRRDQPKYTETLIL